MADTETTTNLSRVAYSPILTNDDLDFLENHIDELAKVFESLRKSKDKKTRTAAKVGLKHTGKLQERRSDLSVVYLQTRKTASPNDDAPFGAVCKMQEAFEALEAYVQILYAISGDNLQNNQYIALSRTAEDISAQLEILDKLHSTAHRALHPCREKYDREGWPGEAKADKAAGGANG